MKTLVIDAIIGAGFPTLTLALTAEQAGMAEFKGDLFDAKHVWRRDKLEGQTLPVLQGIYEGLRAEREAQVEGRAEGAAVTAQPSLVIHPGMH